MMQDLLKKYWSSRAQEEQNAAELAMLHTFVFDRPWDFEATDFPVYLGDPVDWEARANGDAEFLFQLNRHRFLLSLAESYALTGRQKYITGFRRLLTDWADFAVYNEQTARTVWRSLDTAERCANWVKSLFLIQDALSDRLKTKIATLLRQHIEVLLRAESVNNLVSNWGYFHDHGLFFAALYFQDMPLLAKVFENMQRRFSYQFAPDGAHREASGTYQAAILIFYLDVLLFSRLQGLTVPPALYQQAKQCADALLYLQTPDHHLLPFGDADTDDVRDLMTRAALLLSDGRYKAFGYPVLDYDTLLFADAAMVTDYDALMPQPLTELTFFAPEGGHLLSRSDASPLANLLHLMNTPYGGGHSHSDKLHLDLFLNGQPILTDSGRYTYRDCPERLAIKSAMAHNVCTVDGLDYQKPLSSWEMASPAAVSPIQYRETADFLFAQGSHYGYLRSAETLCTRQVLWLKPDIYLVADVFHSPKKHTYTAYFHLAPAIRAVQEDGKLRCHADGFDVMLYPFWDNSKITLHKSLYAPRYNKKTERNCVCIASEGQDNAACFTLLAEDGKLQNLTPLPCEKPAKAIAFTAGGRRVAFFITPEENRGAVCAGSYTFTGKTAVSIDGKLYILNR